MNETTRPRTTPEADRAPVAMSGFSPEALADRFALKPFQGRQLFRWIHQKRVFSVDDMTDLSKDVRKRIGEEHVPAALEPIRFSDSPNTRTRKALFRLQDGETVESVLIPASDRVTLCLSTQVGCPVKCSFCATGLSGYARNLGEGEIVEQALYLLREADLQGRTPNIVFMGMGEPLRNYDATMAAIRLLMHPDGSGIGARRITVSTAGEVKGIERFAEEDWQVRLSVSLHAANDSLRDELVPLNRRYKLARLMDAVDTYLHERRRQITFEWTLLAGVNDREQDAIELTRLIAQRPIIVNLIPYNPVPGVPYRPPSRAQAKAFAHALQQQGIRTTLRLERGQDINAACGQLRRQSLSSLDAP